MTGAADQKTMFLVTEENPDGWKIEDILTVIQNDIIRRTGKIIGDTRPEARAVLANNIEILRYLSKCIDHALDSTQLLDKSFGPHKDGKPRIGVA
jgi:hypothetical protein